MSHRRISAPCKFCGTQMSNPDRIKRRIWQGVMFPNSGRFECSNCGRKQSFTNLNRFVEKPTLQSLYNRKALEKAPLARPQERTEPSVLDLDYNESLRAIVVKQQRKISALESELGRLKKTSRNH